MGFKFKATLSVALALKVLKDGQIWSKPSWVDGFYDGDGRQFILSAISGSMTVPETTRCQNGPIDFRSLQTQSSNF